ncbi:MAG: hypothetical protein JSV55_00550 [Deltaproteobacteria bacterium]|nr:MAG: hypothetical protein JSV55_00550 [Deltaproteobacteria bacterium]
MKVGVPKEIKLAERRVAATPAGVKALTDYGHKVLVEAGASIGSGFVNDEYLQAGAEMCERAQEVWTEAEMILKVKEPIRLEFSWMRPGQILFTYLHLAADQELTEKLLAKKVVGIACETVQLADGTLPLLAPMNEVAGALSIHVGAYCLEGKNGGMCINTCLNVSVANGS